MKAALRAVGLVLAGYGLLILIGVIAHEATWVGAACLTGGAMLAVATWLPRRRASVADESAKAATDGTPPPALALDAQAVARDEHRRAFRRRAVMFLGAFCAIGVIAYNVATHSGFAAAEYAILAYGICLTIAAGRLDRTVSRRGPATVGDCVGWSFALVLAPLALYALNAVMSRADTGSAADPAVTAIVVAPTAWMLQLFGTDLVREGSNLMLTTPRGRLVLGVGLVCAGLYPMVLFGGLMAVHAWRERLGWRRALTLAALGLAGLWLVNIIRLLLLVQVGIAYGPAALDSTHANAGWILFALYMLLFWWLVHRRERLARAGAKPPSGPPGNVPG